MRPKYPPEFWSEGAKERHAQAKERMRLLAQSLGEEDLSALASMAMEGLCVAHFAANFMRMVATLKESRPKAFKHIMDEVAKRYDDDEGVLDFSRMYFVVATHRDWMSELTHFIEVDLERPTDNQ